MAVGRDGGILGAPDAGVRFTQAVGAETTAHLVWILARRLPAADAGAHTDE